MYKIKKNINIIFKKNYIRLKSMEKNFSNIINSISVTLYYQVHHVIRGKSIKEETGGRLSEVGYLLFQNNIIDYAENIQDPKMFSHQVNAFYKYYVNTYTAVINKKQFVSYFLLKHNNAKLINKMDNTEKMNCFRSIFYNTIMQYHEYLNKTDEYMYYSIEIDNDTRAALINEIKKLLSSNAVQITYKLLNPDSANVSIYQYRELCAKYSMMEKKYKKKIEKKSAEADFYRNKYLKLKKSIDVNWDTESILSSQSSQSKKSKNEDIHSDIESVFSDVTN